MRAKRWNKFSRGCFVGRLRRLPRKDLIGTLKKLPAMLPRWLMKAGLNPCADAQELPRSEPNGSGTLAGS